MKDIQLIIPMSGIGKRFIDAGYKVPKPLIEVDGYPMIKHVIELFPGVEDIAFICNEVHLERTNMEKIIQSICPRGKIYSVPNKNRKGPVDAILKIIDYIDEKKETIVSYCDYGTVWSFESFLNYVKSEDIDGVIPCYSGFHPHMLHGENYAFCKTEGRKIIEVKEKESFSNDKMSEWASNGTYYFKTGHLLKKYFQKLVDLKISVNGEYYCSLVYNLMIEDNLKVSIFEIEKMLQWGTPKDLEIYKSWSKYFENKKNKFSVINNPDKTTLILPMAGKGSRFSEEGYILPKPLLKVDEDPMIIQAVRCLPKCEKNVFICLSQHIKEYKLDDILSEHFENCEIKIIEETTQGQACTCEIGLKESNLNLEYPIMISACDNGVLYDEKKYLELIQDTTIDVIVWSFRNNQASKMNPNMYAWLNVDEQDNILHVSCKKFIYKDPLKTHAILGTMFFRKAKYFINGLTKNYLEDIKTNNEFYVDDVINQNIKEGLKVKIFEVENYVCWGTPHDYETYQYYSDYFRRNKL